MSVLLKDKILGETITLLESPKYSNTYLCKKMFQIFQLGTNLQIIPTKIYTTLLHVILCNNKAYKCGTFTKILNREFISFAVAWNSNRISFYAMPKKIQPPNIE